MGFLDNAGVARLWEKVKAYVDSKLGAVTPYGACSTAAATAAKTVTVDSDSFVLKAGAGVRVKFTNSNTASSPTLNVNGTGAKAIRRYGTTAASTTAGSSWNAGSVVDLTYDGSYWYINNFLNTTYSSMTAAEYEAGTGTTARLITPARLKAAILTWASEKLHSHDNATTDASGFMSVDDKTKLDGIAEGANNYELTSGKVYTALGYHPIRKITTSSTNGCINVVKDDGTGERVEVGGLGSVAYTDSTDYAEAIHSHEIASASKSGFMSADMAKKLNSIPTGGGTYTLPTASSSTLGGVKTGSNITNTSGTISLTAGNVTSALGFTPVRQGGGTDQTSNIIYIGWSNEGKVKCQVDATNMGNIALESWVSSNYQPKGSYMPSDKFIFDTYSKSITVPGTGAYTFTMAALRNKSGYTLRGYLNLNSGYGDQWLISYGTYGSNVQAMVYSKYGASLTQTISCTAVWEKN